MVQVMTTLGQYTERKDVKVDVKGLRIRRFTLWRTLALGALLCCGLGAHSQTAKQNLAKFDYRAYHFGFLLSGNTSSFNFQLRPDYTFSDSLLSVENNALAGFNLALLASLNVNQTIRIRFIPGLSFQDRGMLFRFRNPDGTTNPVSVRTESVFLDFPLIVKLRTERIGNFAPYALVGGKISRDMQSQADVNQSLGSPQTSFLSARHKPPTKSLARSTRFSSIDCSFCKRSKSLASCLHPPNSKFPFKNILIAQVGRAS